MGLSKDSPFYPLPSNRVILETANCLAFFDAYPVSRGHVLVVPSRPVLSIYELDGCLQAELWETVRHVREILSQKFSPAGFNVGVNDGRAAGQTVPHAHIHVIPRYAGDVPDPRGGVRWVIPQNARYWGDAAAEKAVEVVGIDVGVAKGLHVVSLRLSDHAVFGRPAVLGNGISVEEAVDICLTTRPACIAIDSPPAWAHSGNARKCEDELRALGIRLYTTPSDPRKQRSSFYGWMQVGFGLFRALHSRYPLYREGAFAETYRAQVEALVKDLASDNPALQRIQRGEELSSDDIDAIAAALNGPDLFVTEERLREAYHQPKGSLADFLRHILKVSALPSREESISRAFDAWVRMHPTLSATQLMFVRTLRKAVMQKAEITSLDALRQPPFSAIGDPDTLFAKPDLNDLFELVLELVA